MAGESSASSLDWWRNFFAGAGAGATIFEVIQHAILVAAADCPTELLSQRDKIVETLYTCRSKRCACNPFEHGTPETVVEENGSNVGAQKESKADSKDNFEPTTSNEPRTSTEPENLNQFESKYSYGEAEALTDEIEEKNRAFEEVMRIKEVLANWKNESEEVLFESLSQLQLMRLTIEILHATQIGRAVICLQKHTSRRIQHLGRTLIQGWRLLADEWVSAVRVLKDTSNSVDPSKDEDECPPTGLAFPPLDVGALLAEQTTSIELSKFFNGIDDDGNVKDNGEFENGRQPHVQATSSVRKEGHDQTQEAAIRPPNPMEVTHKPLKISLAPQRPKPQAVEQRATATSNTEKMKEPIVEVPKQSEEPSYKEMIDIAKRRLQERYQEVANAKKQRMVQMVELRDLPNQSHKQGHSIAKPRTHRK